MSRYVPNPQHKSAATEAGPPALRSDKTPCPQDVTATDCQELLDTSLPEHPEDPRSRRYGLRRSTRGLEVYAAHAHSPEGVEPIEFHGFPVATAPSKVLRKFLERGDIGKNEYNKLVQGRL